MRAHPCIQIGLAVCRILMITIPPFWLGPRRFICEWMREWLFVFGSLHVILLPALCDHVRFSLFEPREKPIPAGRPCSKFIFKFPVGFQHTKFAAKHLKHTSSNREE